MKQVMQIALLLLIILIVIMFINRNNLPFGYRKVEQKTTSKYVKENPDNAPMHGKTEVHTTRVEKPTHEGSQVTIKEKVTTSSK